MFRQVIYQNPQFGRNDIIKGYKPIQVRILKSNLTQRPELRAKQAQLQQSIDNLPPTAEGLSDNGIGNTLQCKSTPYML